MSRNNYIQNKSLRTFFIASALISLVSQINTLIDGVMVSCFVSFDALSARKDPNVSVEVGHSSCNVCNIGNIAIELNRPVRWNPIVQKFMNDEEATKFLHYQYREGYSLEF